MVEATNKPPVNPVSADAASQATGANIAHKTQHTNGAAELTNGVLLKESALDYLQYGWGVVRLPPKSKEPYKGKTREACGVTNDNVDKLRADENLGVVFKTAGPLKDLDLDFQTAVDLAKAVGLGVTTAAFGRKSVTGHYLFNAPGCETKKFKLPEGDYPRPLPTHWGVDDNGKPVLEPSPCILEIRGSDNDYTVFPPSIHPCGEQLEWVSSKREPVTLTAEDLRALAGRHAVAAAVIYFYPKTASARYDVRMSLMGALLRSGMPAGDVALYAQRRQFH
jgi:hypothetical protein